MTLLLGLLVGGGLASCSDKDNGDGDSKEIANPIASVVAVDGSKTANAVISDADKTIKDWYSLFRFNKVPIAS